MHPVLRNFETEDELLQEQELFMKSGEKPSAQINIKKMNENKDEISKEEIRDAQEIKEEKVRKVSLFKQAMMKKRNEENKCIIPEVFKIQETNKKMEMKIEKQTNVISEISKENEEKLKKMSKEEIISIQKELKSIYSDDLLEKLKKIQISDLMLKYQSSENENEDLSSNSEEENNEEIPQLKIETEDRILKVNLYGTFTEEDIMTNINLEETEGIDPEKTFFNINEIIALMNSRSFSHNLLAIKLFSNFCRSEKALSFILSADHYSFINSIHWMCKSSILQLNNISIEFLTLITGILKSEIDKMILDIEFPFITNFDILIKYYQIKNPLYDFQTLQKISEWISQLCSSLIYLGILNDLYPKNLFLDTESKQSKENQNSEFKSKIVKHMNFLENYFFLFLFKKNDQKESQDIDSLFKSILFKVL